IFCSTSDDVTVEYEVRQGSILGALQYPVLVADMPKLVGIGGLDNSGYVDDIVLWISWTDSNS
ncbi:Hypothetical protein FKW44_015746, partial [Caligus rogercresseyi]